MKTERTFLTPFDDANGLLSECHQSLGYYADALRASGNENLADNLDHIAKCLSDARRLVEQGQSETLDRFINGANQASTNMVKAALAVALPPTSR